MSERQKIEIGVGEKGAPPAGAEIKDGAKPEESEVGGRYRRWTAVSCPHCWAVNNIYEETTARLWWQCWNCRGVFLY